METLCCHINCLKLHRPNLVQQRGGAQYGYTCGCRGDYLQYLNLYLHNTDVTFKYPHLLGYYGYYLLFTYYVMDLF
jgi:hypothetical protein